MNAFTNMQNVLLQLTKSWDLHYKYPILLTDLTSYALGYAPLNQRQRPEMPNVKYARDTSLRGAYVILAIGVSSSS